MWQNDDRHVAILCGLMKKGLQERELHLSIPEGSRNNPVTSSQPRRKSNKEESINERKKGNRDKKKKSESRVEEYSMWGRVGEKQWECEERKARLQEEGGNAAESFRWKLLEWEDHDCSQIWTPPVWITADPAADTRMSSVAVNAGRTSERSHWWPLNGPHNEYIKFQRTFSHNLKWLRLEDYHHLCIPHLKIGWQ